MKLFFNASYDFTDTADKISAHLTAPLQAALGGFPNRPTALQVVGLPEKQGWFGQSLAQALTLKNWAPDMAKICAQLELSVEAGSEPTANTLSLVQLAATGEARQAAWLPGFLDERAASAPVQVAATLPAPVVVMAATAPAPASAKAPVTKAPPAPAPRVAAPLPKPVVPSPSPNKAPSKPLKAAVAAAPVQAPVNNPAAKAAPPVVRAPEPVVAKNPVPALSVAPRRPVGLYAVIITAGVLALGAGVKLYTDQAKKAEALALQQAAEEPSQLPQEKIEAMLKVNPATGLPGPWVQTNIGYGVAAGSVEFKQGEFRLKGLGRDIRQGFLFAYVPMAGDGAITARVGIPAAAGGAAKFGLMLRGDLTVNAAHVSLLLDSHGEDLKTLWREKADPKTKAAVATKNAAIGGQVWLRLVRAGQMITAYQSDNGYAWSVVAGTPVTVGMPDTLYAGFAVCSPENNPAVTTFDHVRLPGWESAPVVLTVAAK